MSGLTTNVSNAANDEMIMNREMKALNPNQKKQNLSKKDNTSCSFVSSPFGVEIKESRSFIIR